MIHQNLPISFFAPFFRYSKEISSLDKVPREPGQVGIVSIPKVYTTMFSEVVDSRAYMPAVRRREHQIPDDLLVPTTALEITDRLNRLKGERNEKEVFRLLHLYFQKKKIKNGGVPDDCLILTNQQLVDPRSGRWYERDFVIVNLSAGYIMNIECKSYLNLQRLNDPKGGAKEQLRISKDIVTELFGGIINESWDFVSAIFCSEVDQEVIICDGCWPYILTSNGKTRHTRYLELKNIMPRDIIDSTPGLAQDFQFICKTLIFNGVQIEDDIINKICANVDKAGSARNVAFWSPEQRDILDDDNKRVLLMSSNSTGKTILMLYQAKKLLDAGEKVVFLVYQHHIRKRKSLLQLKIEADFHRFLTTGQLEVKQFCGNFEEILNDFQAYSEEHLFVDELLILYDPTGQIVEYVPHIENILKTWDEQHNWSKFLWIAVAGFDGKIPFEAFQNARHAFFIPELTYPLRNTVEILHLVQAFQTNSNPDFRLSDLDVGLPGNKVKNYWNVTIPNNLTNTFYPVQLTYRKASDAIKAAFDHIREKSEKQNPCAMIIIATQLSKDELRSSRISALRIIEVIFNNANRPLPLLHSFLNESEHFHEDDIKNWMTQPNDRRRDLVVDYATSHGCENDIIIFMQKKGEMISPNSLLRAKSLLFVLTFDDLI